MISNTPPELVDRAQEPASAQPKPKTYPLPSKAWRAFMWCVKYWIGMIFCQSPTGAMLLIGWTYRLAQRFAIHHWWKRSSHQRNGGCFTSFLAESEATAGHIHWPNWFLSQNFKSRRSRDEGTSQGKHAWFFFKSLTGSLRQNFWTGLTGIFNTSVFILPAGLLMWFGWYDGWQNSFNKGYEEFFVGVSISWIGIFLFIAAMFLIPMAQARQAASGDWRAFYNFRVVWTIVRGQWFWCLALALGYLALASPIQVMKSAPMYLVGHPGQSELLTPEAAKKYLESYFFWWSIYALPAYVILRIVAAKIYAHGLLRALTDSHLVEKDLSPFEQETLSRLNLLHAAPPVERHVGWRLVLWMGTRVGRVTSGIALFFIWFGLITQIYLTEFLKHHVSGIGFFNQPLIQLPWIHYMPIHIEHPLTMLGGLLLLILAAIVARKFWHFATLMFTKPRELISR